MTKPELHLEQSSESQQATAWRAVAHTLNNCIGHDVWNKELYYSSTANACAMIEKLANDSKTLTKYREALGPEGCGAIRHLSMLDEKDGISYVPAKIPDSFTRRSKTFSYSIDACSTLDHFNTELSRVINRFTAGLTGDKQVEIVEINLDKHYIRLRWAELLTKNDIIKYAQVKLQQIINDYVGEQK
jgi:hypothetical protein